MTLQTMPPNSKGSFERSAPKSQSIGVVLLGVVAATFLAWRPWELRRERWIRSAMRQLRQAPPPPTSLAPSLSSKEWTLDYDGQGYIFFTNGWAWFATHTVESSKRVGDIGLLRASDGSFYICHHHFSYGVGAYLQWPKANDKQQPRPRDIRHFIELYGQTQGWKRIPDA